MFSFNLLIKFIIFVVLSIHISVGSASAGAREAKAIVDGGKWHFTEAQKSASTAGFAGTFNFKKDGTLRFFSRSFSLRGEYTREGGRLCMKVFRIWGKKWQCSGVGKEGDAYYWAGFKLRKR